ncbi:MAG: AAA family ATPase [Candidatus Tectimicrobiota bacterium]
MRCSALVEALRHPEFYPEPTRHVEIRETHASLVFLTEHYAYKLKKAVNFGFLDYSTLARRQFCCHEELRLNRRLAPSVYVDVLALHQTPQGYSWHGPGPIVDYVLKMRRLPEQANLEALLRQHAVPPQTMARLAQRLATFHALPAALPAAQTYGTLRQVEADWQDNFVQTLPWTGKTLTLLDYEQIQQAVQLFLQRHADWFARRLADGHIRDCHGDLRAEHVYVLDGDIQMIDCIEFSPALRFIDVASDIAFLAMDLERLGFPGVAAQFVQAYVAATDDVTLYRLLDFYRCYRAYVRGKVTSLRLQEALAAQDRPNVQHAAAQAFCLALRYARRCVRPVCLLTTGLIGSGKSTLATGVATALDAVLLSSDRLRKTQAGLVPETRQHVAYGVGLYSAETTRQTYETLAALARQHLSQGQSVVLDASFARRAERQRLAELARDLGAACAVLECVVPEAVLRQRLEQRSRQSGAVSDGRVEILSQFRAAYEPLQADEALKHLRLDMTQDLRTCVQDVLARVTADDDDNLSPQSDRV